MYPIVQKQFRLFNEPFEGSIPYMYVDVKQLVTVGVGNLIDPVHLALELPFQFKNKPGAATPGAPASQEHIAAEWQRVKSDTSLAKKGCRACEAITELELSDAAIDSLIAQRLTGNETFLKARPPFKNWDTWPADAQLAVLSMAWAMGVGNVMNFHKFCAACAALDFNTAAAESKMQEAGNPGVIPRNRANFKLLSNAAIVQASGPDAGFEPSTLYYPKILTKAASTG